MHEVKVFLYVMSLSFILPLYLCWLTLLACKASPSFAVQSAID